MKILSLSVVTALSVLALSFVDVDVGRVDAATPTGLAQTVQATNGSVTGLVVDAETGDPLAGAQVVVQGTDRGTLTNQAGRYVVLGVPAGSYEVRVVILGFTQQRQDITIVAGQAVVADFNLSASPVEFDDLRVDVITDEIQRAREIGTRNRKSGIRGVPAAPLASLEEVASRRIEGLVLNGMGGSIGGGQKIRIRGKNSISLSNEPLAVVESYAMIDDNRFLAATANPRSTFAIDVDRASYSNIRRFLSYGQRPPVDAVRIEELVNYFPYDYKEPKGRHPFAVHSEVAPTPWNPSHLLVKIGIKGKSIDRASLPPSNLVFLLDVSGSMGSSDKLPLLKSALSMLVDELRPEDRIAMVVYAGAAGLVLESTPGDQKATILSALNALSSGGSTAGGAGIQLAYEVARRNWIADGNNRVILATDGDFNVGASSEGDLRRLIEEKREEGTFLTVLGFGTGNYQDAKMEQLADHGNGNFAYIDNLTEARKVLVTEMGGTLHAIAKDVKIQVEFNADRVQAHRLIGYENRMLAAEDFNDDSKDAGELGAGHTVTALYEIIPVGVDSELAPLPIDPLRYDGADVIGPPALKSATGVLQAWSGAVRAIASAAMRFLTRSEPELMYVKLRYKRPDSDRSVLLSQAVYDDAEPPSEDLRFASAVAAFGMILRGSPYCDADLNDVKAWAKAGLGADPEGYRAEFLRMVEAARAL